MELNPAKQLIKTKIYLIVLLALMGMSSCIKVEQVSLCSNPPPAPTLSNTDIQLAADSTMVVRIISPVSSYTYLWLGPGNTVLQSNAILLSSFPGSLCYGNWMVIAQKGFACTSDTVRLAVSPPFQNCGLQRNVFDVMGTSQALSFVTAPNYPGNPYQVSFTDNQYGTFNIYFANQPTPGVYNLTSNSYLTLLSNQAYISYNGGYGFTSYSGVVTVVANGNQIEISFCNAAFINNSTGINVTGSGYLIGH